MLEQLLMSLKVMVLGLAAVFAGLALLIIFVDLMYKIFGNQKKEKNKNSNASDKAPVVNTDDNRIIADNNSIDEDEELIAVISAAVAAAMNKSTHDIVVKSVRRIEFHSPVWNRVSRQEQISTRL